MYNETITLFNRYSSKLGDAWYPTVIYGSNLNIDKAAIVAKYGAEAQDNASLNIPYMTINGDRYVSGKKWLPPKEWDRQVNEDLPRTLTFTGGKDFDFFMLGEWQGESIILDDDYVDGFFNHMSAKYDYVFAITGVAMYSVIPHFEVMGK